MDKKIIQAFGTEILSYRIRSERQKIRAQYDDFDKQLRKLDREEDELYRQRRNLGWTPLNPPIQRGWKRYFVLREDVARSRHAEVLERILAKINTYDWSSRRDFTVRKRKFGRKSRVVRPQRLQEPDECEFNQLDLSASEKHWFYPELRYRKTSGMYRLVYVFKEPWRFVLRIRPHMVDKVRAHDADLEAKLQQISNYLERNGYVWWKNKILHGRARYRREEHRDWNPIWNKTLQTIIAEAEEEVWEPYRKYHIGLP